jgi:hypothetical protein
MPRNIEMLSLEVMYLLLIYLLFLTPCRQSQK